MYLTSWTSTSRVWLQFCKKSMSKSSNGAKLWLFEYHHHAFRNMMMKIVLSHKYSYYWNGMFIFFIIGIWEFASADELRILLNAHTLRLCCWIAQTMQTLDVMLTHCADWWCDDGCCRDGWCVLHRLLRRRSSYSRDDCGTDSFNIRIGESLCLSLS